MAHETYHQHSIFEWSLHQFLDPGHELLQLAQQIDWDRMMEELRKYYSRQGRRPKSTRLMVGLMILKHRYNMSDEEVVSGLHENVYWMAFCGVSPERSEIVEASTLCKFRRRIGAEGTGFIEAIIRDQLIQGRHMTHRVMLADTTAMEKHIAYPTETGLLQRGRIRVMKGIQKLVALGVEAPGGLRTFTRVSKKVLVDINKLGRDRAERIRDGAYQLVEYARHTLKAVPQVIDQMGPVIKRLSQSGEEKIARKAEAIEKTVRSESMKLLQVIDQTIARYQELPQGRKLYSMHEPHVTCIRKGKRSKPNEYGSKVALCVDRKGYVVGHQEYTDNRQDGKTLADALKSWKEAFGRLPWGLGADRGYHSREGGSPQELGQVERVAIPARGRYKPPEERAPWFRRLSAKRAGIEAIISHLKTDHRMNRSRYKGFVGDQMNVSWAVIAWNTKKWLADSS